MDDGQAVAAEVVPQSSRFPSRPRIALGREPALFAATSMKSRPVRKLGSMSPPLRPAQPFGRCSDMIRLGARGQVSTRGSRERSSPINPTRCRLERGCGSWAVASLRRSRQRQRCYRMDKSSGGDKAEQTAIPEPLRHPSFTTCSKPSVQAPRLIRSPPAYDGHWYRRSDGFIFGIRRSPSNGITFDVIENDHRYS